MNKKSAIATALLGVCVLCFCPLAWTQEPVLDELYGQGVHDYFAHRLSEARQSLTAAIDQGSKDPRCFYFRGLCSLRIGNQAEAEKDFRRGAALEVRGRDRIYPVGRSLQRIQGRGRMVLEKHRRDARVAARIEAMRMQRARYEEQMERDKADVVREPRRPAARPPLTADPGADPTDPFIMDEAVARPVPPKPAEVPAEPSTPPSESPAATSPAAPPAEDDPFDTPVVDDPFDTPATPAPAEDASPAPVDEDPFTPASPPPADDTPATPPPADEDPFDDPFN